MDKIVQDFLSLKPPFQNLYYMSEVHDKQKHKEFHIAFKNYLKLQDKQNKKYYYMITFTLNDKSKDEDPIKINKYIISRLQRPALKIEKAHIVQELTQQDRPHWHASVISKKYISQDRFKYYTKQYGNIDISKNHSQNYKTMLTYISKSTIPKQIIGV